MRFAINLVCLLLFLVPNILASGRGTTGANFLKISLGAASVGMGEASTTLEGDVASVFYNPAGLVGLEMHTLTATHLNWIEGMQYEALAYGKPIVEFGTVGASVFLFHMPDIELVDENGAADGSARVYDLGVQFSYARHLLPWLDVKGLTGGVNLKLLHRELAGYQSSGVAADLGFMYHWNQDWTFGLSALNLGYLSGFETQSDPLPITFRLGARFSRQLLKQHVVSVLADMVQPLDNSLRANFGLEYVFNRMIKVRLGYKLGYHTDGFQTGAGFQWQNFSLDYALKVMNVFGLTHYVSATVAFGISRQQEEEERVYKMLEEAEGLFSQSKYEEALTIVEKALLISPENEDVLTLQNKLRTVLEMLKLPAVPDDASESQPQLLPGKRLTPDKAEELGIPYEE